MAEGNTNHEFINSLKKFKVLTSPRVERVLSKVDRVNFMPDKKHAYVDSPAPIGASYRSMVA